MGRISTDGEEGRYAACVPQQQVSHAKALMAMEAKAEEARAKGEKAKGPSADRRSNFWALVSEPGEPSSYPLVAVAARKLLAMHVTIAAAERNWSEWGRMYTPIRNALSIYRAKKMVTINAQLGGEGGGGAGGAARDGVKIGRVRGGVVGGNGASRCRGQCTWT